ncbi:MAG: enoyl-CoA hydratase/isomerase family protein [Syntrophales bacterium]|jgi:2-(1,2-epoxy-1,2-dihydrophenyl)acetyl-CoA isomerase|nr:enoyl-CoA hydratase/isomerase family protein [Syntrophales bacterium]MDY0045680.1 enoyl-CoA hydratase/isomerase family protein [Syntrophales bacterium]
MARTDVLYEKKDQIGIITLNRPEKMNAMTHEMLALFLEITEQIRKDDDVRAVILTGKGKCFCAGTDLSGDVPEAVETELNYLKSKDTTIYSYNAWFFASIPKPVICALNGPAVGAGSEYPLHCDIRIAGKSAKWGEVFVRRGLIPDTGAGTYLLPHIVGFSKAAELCMSGEVIDAEEMLRIGLVHEVVPDDELMPAAMKLASKFLKAAPLAVKMTKQLLYMGLQRTIDHHSEATRYCFQLATKTEDMMEGINSFLEKRDPVWKNR